MWELIGVVLVYNAIWFFWCLFDMPTGSMTSSDDQSKA